MVLQTRRDLVTTDLFVQVKPVEQPVGLKVGLQSIHHQRDLGVVPSDDDVVPLTVVQ